MKEVICLLNRNKGNKGLEQMKGTKINRMKHTGYLAIFSSPTL